MFPGVYFSEFFFANQFYQNSSGEGTSQQLTGLSVVKRLLLPRGIHGVYLQAETKNVRYRMDGIDPTATVGLILYAGAAPTYLNRKLSKLRFIEVEASAKLNCQFV